MAMDLSVAQRPPHVRPDQVLDFDFFAFDAPDGEYQAQMMQAMRTPGTPDVFWTPRNTGHWVAARADAMEQVFMNPDLFSSSQFMVIKEMNADPPLAPLMLDPPEHKKYRSLLMKAFTPSAVEGLAADARALAIDLIEGFKDKGRCAFIGDFALHLPITIFMSVVGWPLADREKLVLIAEKIARPASIEDAEQGRAEIDEYCRAMVAERSGHLGSDLTSDLIRAQVDGQPIPPEILRGMFNLLFTAGLDTVATSMGYQAKYLARNPELRKRLIDRPEDIPKAIEELLRRYPIGNLGRKVMRDCEFFGAQLRAGDAILLPVAGYNLDDRKFRDPLAVDIDRERTIHFSFGAGVHRCVGAKLARTELQIFFEEWLRRIPDFGIPTDATVRCVPGLVPSLPSLPLVWEVN